ncbi:MAG: ABC transporter ATP-binding protein, partial [Chloroflexi bacterium]|nr:ABC transporter ATP-binding protein [Chloroflexota bacterium]
MINAGTESPVTAAPGEDTGSGGINLWTGFRLLLPFARNGWVAFAIAATLSAIASLALLGPFWVIYRVVDEIVAGEATRDGMYGYAALAAGFVVLQYGLMAIAE